MSKQTAPNVIKGDVIFRTRYVLVASTALSLLFVTIALAMIFEPSGTSNTQVHSGGDNAFGWWLLFATLCFMAYAWVSSRIKVSVTEITYFRLWLRRIKLIELAGVTHESAYTGAHLRSVLCFHFVDGRRFLYRNFSGSPKEGNDTWMNVDNARVLIEQRIAEAHRVDRNLAAPASHPESSTDIPGGPPA